MTWLGPCTAEPHDRKLGRVQERFQAHRPRAQLCVPERPEGLIRRIDWGESKHRDDPTATRARLAASIGWLWVPRRGGAIPQTTRGCARRTRCWPQRSPYRTLPDP